MTETSILQDKIATLVLIFAVPVTVLLVLLYCA